MANTRFFIAKNGIATAGRGLFGTLTDNGTDTLQVTGTSIFSGQAEITNSVANTYSLLVRNTANSHPANLAQFIGDSNSLNITNSSAGVYDIGNANNVIRFYANTQGLDLLYNNSSRLSITSTGNDFTGLANTTIEGFRILTTADEGSGNGLDADTLDGLDSTQFLRSDEDDTMVGNLTIQGNLTVSGNTTYVDTETILLSDNIITLNANHTGAPTQDAGIEINRGTSANTYFLWNETNDEWTLDSNTTIDSINPTFKFKGDDGNTYIITYNESATRMELGDDTNTNLYLNADGSAEFNYALSANSFTSVTTISAGSSITANTTITAGTDVIGQRFIDADNNSYFANPAGTSVFNDLGIDDDIFHNGDTDTLLRFADNDISLQTGGAERIGIENTRVDVTVDLYAPRLVDADNNSYVVDPAGTSTVNKVGIDDDLFHNGNDTTKLSFLNNQINLATAGTNRVAIQNNRVDVSVDLYAPKLIDSNNNSYYVDPHSFSQFFSADFDGTVTGVDINLSGDITGVNGTFTGDLSAENLVANNNITAGNDITADGDLLVKGQITSWGDITSNNDIYALNRVYASQFRDIDNTSFYGDFASTSRMVSIALAGIISNDSNQSTYLDFTGVNQFSIFTNGTENFRINDTYAQIFHQVRAPIYYDSNDLTYFGDFGGVSNISAINLNLRIQAWNDSGTNINFTTDQFNVNTGGATRFIVNNTYAEANHSFRAPIFYDSADTGYYWDPNTNNAHRFYTPSGWLTIGPQNTSYNHFTTDRPSHYFDKQVIFDGNIGTYTGDETATFARFIDSNDVTFYGDFASTSRINNIDLAGIIAHDGDADTYIEFPNPNEFRIQVGGNTALFANTTVLSTDLNFEGVDGTFSGDISADNVTATTAMYSPIYYDSDNINYYGDFASTSVLNKLHIGSTASLTDGTDPDISTTTIFSTTKVVTPKLVFLNDTTGDDNYLTVDDNNNAYTVTGQAMGAWWQFYGDKLGPDTTNSSGLVASGVRTSYLEVKNQIWAPIYYDRTNQNYYWDPNNASSHRFGTPNGTVNIGAEDASYAHFRTDRPAFYFDKTTYIDGDIRSFSGFTAAYFDFYYDSGDTAYYVDPQATSRMNRINLVDKIRSASDTTNWIKFPGTDDFEIVTNSIRRFYVTNTYIESSVDFRAPRFIDYDDNNYYIDLTNTTTSMFAGGSIRQGIITDGTRWLDNSGNGGIALNTHAWDGVTGNSNIAVSGTAGGQAMVSLNRLNNTETNPWTFGGKYLDFLQDGSSIGSIAIESAGDNMFFLLNGSPANPTSENGFQIWTGDTFIPIVNFAHDGQIFFGNYFPVYTQNDNTPLVGSVSANKFHFDGGSIQLNGGNDAIVFGAGTASFLKDEELAFGWGGGIYMTDATYLRIRNNKTVYSTGDAWFSRIYAQQNQNYYLDPDGDSQFNTIDIDDYIRHRGDTNTHIGFPSADQVEIRTNGVQRALIDANEARFRRQIRNYTPSDLLIHKDANGGGIGITISDNNNGEFTYNQSGRIAFYHGDGAITAGSSAAWVFTTTEPVSHYVFGSDSDGAGTTAANHAAILPQVNNTGYLGYSNYRWQWLYAGSANFSSNVTANDVTGNNAYFYRYYDRNNNSYYGDFNAKSIMNQIGLDDYIEHNGDTDTYIQFNGADSWRVVTGGAARLLVNNSYVRATPEFRTPIMYDNDDTAWYVDPAGDSKLNEILLDTGEVRLRRPTGTYGSLEIDGGPLNSWEGFSIGGRSVFMHDNSVTSGLYNDVNNHWMVLLRHGAYAGAGVELRWNNTSHAEVHNGYFLAPTAARSPIFQDSNDTNYYGDFAGTSRMNTIHANRIYPAYDDNTAIYIDYPTGDYGSIQVNGAGKGGWQGYSIDGQFVLMSPGTDRVGIYNDLDNEWMTQWYRNAEMRMYYNGVEQGSTRDGHFRATNQMRSPIYYDSTTTSYYLDLGQGNTSNSLQIGGRINRTNFATTGDGDNNRLIVAQDYSHWIWNTATDWGIFWAGNDNAYRSYFSTSNPNEIVFIGGGNLRASIDLDTGNAFFGGEVFADNFQITGPAGNISLNPAYGSGGADLVLFDFTTYSEAELTGPIQGIEILTVDQSEYIEVSDSPFAGKTIQSSAYRRIYSDYIPVVPGEDIYGEISVRYVSGSGGLLYYGVERFDKDKRPIAGNTGTTYFVVSGVNYTSTSWNTYRGHTTIPTSHTPYNGSDGGGVHYVRIRILLNYSSGGALRQFGGIMLKRRNAESNLLVDDLLADDITADQINANIYYDRGDNDYYGDFASTSRMNVVDVNVIRARNDTAYFLDPNADFSMRVYGEISNSNYANGNLQPGALNIGHTNRDYRFTDGSWAGDIRSGIHANFSEVWEMTLHDSADEVNSAIYYDGTDDLILGRDIGWGNMRISAPGNFYADRFIDINNNSFYAAPADESLFRRLSVTDTSAALLSVRRTGSAPGNDRAAYFANEFANHSWGQVAEFRVENTTGGDRANITFSAGNASNNWGIGQFNTNHFGIREYHGFRYGQWGNEKLRIEQDTGNTYLFGNNFYARNLYDYEDNAFYLDPASNSNLRNVYVTDTHYIRGWPTRTYAHSGSDFTAGTLVITDIPSADYGLSFVLEVTGKSYSTDSPFSFIAQGYHYYGVIINASGLHMGKAGFTTLYMQNYNGFLAFWWPRVSYWNSFTVHCRDAGGSDRNRVTSIVNSGLVGSNKATVTMRTTAVRNENINASGDLYASRFVDADNTGYYLDPHSTSNQALRIRGGTLHGPNPTWGAYLAVGTNGHWTGSYASIAATNGNIHIDPRSGGYDIFLNYYVNGRFRVYNTSSAERFRVDTDGITYAFRELRTPIFYDYNNTTYFVDPHTNGQSANFNGWMRADDYYARNWFRNDNSGEGIYNQATGQHFYSDDDDGWNVAGGSAANWIRFRDEYAGVVRGYVYADNGNNIGFLNQGGGWALRTNNGTTEVYGDIYANQFVDRNSPGYYMNPQAVTQLNQVYADNWFRPQNNTGLYFQSFGVGVRSPHSEGNPYGNISTYSTTGRNSWNGYGFRSGYTLMSNNYESPGGVGWSYGRYIGLHMNRRSGIEGYGGLNWIWLYDRWVDNFYYYRRTYFNNGIYAPIYYDTDNPAYYVDPTGYSNMGDIRGTEIYARSWFRNDNNGTGLYNQSTAMHWYSDNSSQWRLYSTSSTSQILFTTSGNSARGYVYADTAPSIGFLDSGGSWALRCVSNSYIYLSHATYVPIIYDTSGSTFWSVDVANLIRTPQIRTDRIYFGRDTANGFAERYGTYSSSLRRIAYMSFDWNANYDLYYYHGIASTGVNGSFGDNMSINSFNDITFRTDTNNNNGTSYIYYYTNTASNGSRQSGYFQQNGSYCYDFIFGDVRAYMFRDAADPSYYLDLNTNSTAYTGRHRAGMLYGPNWTWGAYLTVGTNGRYSGSYASVATTNGNLHLDSRDGYGLYLNWYSPGDIYAPRTIRGRGYADLDSPGYTMHPRFTSRMNIISYDRLSNARAGGNSGINRDSYAYDIFQESGGWSYPYPDLCIDNHTGIKMGANASYEGIRIYYDYYNGAGLHWQFNGSANYSFKYNWLWTNGTGYYTNINGAHFYPNQSTSYGSWNVLGNRSGWYGLAWSQVTWTPHLMFDGNGSGGWYFQAGRWVYYHNRGNNCTGFASSATSSAYSIYVSGAIYATSNIVAYSDRRKKENIITIDNALDKVLQLRGVYYHIKNPEKVAKQESVDIEEVKKRRSGVIAQEVEEIFPEVVTYAADVDQYGVDYGKMAGLFIEAFKDQQDIINNQQKQIDELKELVNKLMEKI